MRQKLTVKCFMAHSYQTHTHTHTHIQTFKHSDIIHVLSTTSVLKHGQSQKPGFHTRYQQLFPTRDTTGLGDYKTDKSRQGPVDVRNNTYTLQQPHQ